MQTLLIIFTLISLSIAYDEGAPEEACQTMDPSTGHDTKPNNSTAPYETVPLEVTIEKGGNVTIVLRALNGTTFKGFMTMAFDVAYPESGPIGTFVVVDPVETQTVNCTTVDSAITQTRDNYKTDITAIWKAPELFFGTVLFKTTFVQRKLSYWVKVPSTTNVTIPYCSGSATVMSSIIVWIAGLVIPLFTLRFISL